MTEWRYSSMTRRGAFIDWTSEPLPGGCLLISIQAMWESWEKRFPPDDLVIPIGKARQKSGRKSASRG